MRLSELPNVENKKNVVWQQNSRILNDTMIIFIWDII